MSLEYLNAAFNLRLEDGPAKAVLIGLANHTNPDGMCWPGVARLMLYTGLAERTVRGAIKRLEELGLLRVERRPQQTSLYWLQLGLEGGASPAPPPAAAAPEPLINPIIPLVSASNKAEDARAPALIDEDWQPSAELTSWAANKYPGVSIPDQVERFVLKNRASGTLLADIDAAFKAWMANTKRLKLPEAPAAPATGGGPVDRQRQIAAMQRTIILYERMGGREQDIKDIETQIRYLQQKEAEDAAAGT